MINFMKKTYLTLIIIFLYAPIVVLIVFSFNVSKSRANFSGFTLNWYFELFKDPSILQALSNTLLIAVISSFIATIIGTLAAVGINNMNSFNKKLILNINNLPVYNPDIVTAVSLMLLFIFAFRFINGQLGFFTILLSHISFNIPYIVLSVLPRLRQMDKNLYEAALDLGASPAYAFTKVVLPEISPGIVTGAILAFTLSLDDFVISFFTTGSGINTLSTLIYSMTKQSINPKINALSTLMFLVVLLLLYLVNMRETKDLKSKKERTIANEAN